MLPTGLVSPSTCNTQGLICDQPTISTATILTYTGSGMSYNGVPLVETAPTGTLVLSADPACAVANGGTLSFPPAALCESAAPLPLPVVPGGTASALSCAALLQHCLSVQLSQLSPRSCSVHRVLVQGAALLPAPSLAFATHHLPVGLLLNSLPHDITCTGALLC
jgi:hypothetical protein